MLKAKSRWRMQSINQIQVKTLQEALNLSSLTAKLLVARGMTNPEEADAFLNVNEKNYLDPFLMDGMEAVVERIKRALANKERILIYGDYDADGVSSTSVMVYTLQKLGADFDYYIPNRFTEGYGPNEKAFRWAREQEFNVIITVDTGISAVHEAKVAKELQLDLLITDHHEPPPELPDAYAIINPKKPGCKYPFKGLAGVGVAFKLAHALLGYIPKELLDIVVIGTVADLVPLQSENRLIVSEGLKKLQHSTKPGLHALLDICGITNQELTTEHIGFAIGPRVNAIGRLDSAMPAVELFTTADNEEAKQLAETIDLANKERQAIVTEITEEAIREVEENYPPKSNEVLVIAKEGWNPGVIGIVASRLVEKYYRPTIILSIDREKGIAKGSARSIEGFDMFENLSLCRDILPHFGGHPMAAGMTLAIEDINKLRDQLNQQAKEQLTIEDFTPITTLDIACSIDDISIKTIEEMNRLAPFGVSNPPPKILIENVKHTELRRIGSDGNHLKIKISNTNSASLDVIGFQFGSLFEHISTDCSMSLVGGLSINEWNGFRKPQLMLEDIKINEWQLFDYRGVRDIEKRITMIPLEKRSLLAFRKSTIEKLKLHNLAQEIIILDADNVASVDTEGKYIFLLDLPYERTQLEFLLEKMGLPERIYPLFYTEEDHYFNPIPSRDQFKWLYAFILKRKTFDIRRNGKELASYKGWTYDTVQFIAKVFLELGFVTINNGILAIADNQKKRDLLESETYRKKFEQTTLEKELCYSSFTQLKEWFLVRMKDTKNAEEAIH